MTTEKRVELEKEILYEHHKAEEDLKAELVQLRRWVRRLQDAGEQLSRFTHSVESTTRPSPVSLPDVDIEEIRIACADTLLTRERLNQLTQDKLGLGL